MPRTANISGRSRRLSLSRRRQSTTRAMTSDGYCVRFSRVPERSLNCLPHARQRKRRQPWAVRSGRSVTASDPHSKHRIRVHPSVRGGPHTQPSPRRPGVVARARTEPSEDAYKRAAQPKELVIVPGAGHVDLYDRGNLIPFDKLTEFFRGNLS